MTVEEFLQSEKQGKEIRIKCKEGQTLLGKYSCYMSAYDNDPDEASIVIDTGIPTSLTEIYLSEIESIEVVDKK